VKAKFVHKNGYQELAEIDDLLTKCHVIKRYYGDDSYPSLEEALAPNAGDTIYTEKLFKKRVYSDGSFDYEEM